MSDRICRKKVRCNAIQKERLLAFMAKNKDLARGLFSDRNTETKKWQILQRELAKLGPSKTVEQWKITWRDLKFRAKWGSQVPRTFRYRTGERARNVEARNYYRQMCGPSDEDKLILSIIGNSPSSNNNTSEERACTEQEKADPRVPPGYQEIMSMFTESDVVDDADIVEIEVSENVTAHHGNSTIKSEVEDNKTTDYEGKDCSAAADREDPLSDSRPGPGAHFEDEVELESLRVQQPVIIENHNSDDNESEKEMNIIDHQHYTSVPRRRKIKLSTSTDELKRMYLRKKYQNACLEREKLLLEISQARKKHELEMLILRKQLNKLR